MKLFFRVRVWLSDLIYPGIRGIGNSGTGEPGSYKKARGCLASGEPQPANLWAVNELAFGDEEDDDE